MSLEQALVERAMEIHKANKGSPQAILDSAYFAALPLDQKKEFIEKHRDYLRQSPKFNWKEFTKGTLGTMGLAATGTMLHQISTKAGPGFKPNFWALGGAAGAGLLVGAAVNAWKSNQEYNRDKVTQQAVDDVINAMVSRGMTKPVTRVDILAKLENEFENKPLEIGRTLSAIDFDKIIEQSAKRNDKGE